MVTKGACPRLGDALAAGPSVADDRLYGGELAGVAALASRVV